VVPLEEVLVDAAALIEDLEGGFQALRIVIDLGGGEAFKIDTRDGEDQSEVSALGEKGVIPDESRRGSLAH
jgi:hypothetical protein